MTVTMFKSKPSLDLLLVFGTVVAGQQAGMYIPETRPTLTIQQCATQGACTAQARSSASNIMSM